MIDGTCDGCRYAVPTVTDDKDLVMKCRRYPPVLFVFEGSVSQGMPDATFKCGEYKTEQRPWINNGRA